VLSDVGMNACDALIDSSPTSPSEGRQEAGSVQSSDSEFYWYAAPCFRHRHSTIAW